MMCGRCRLSLSALVITAVCVAVAGRSSLADQVSKTSVQRNDRRPNIILIMADDLGYGDVGCYGNSGIRTPNIDRLAKEGIRFTDFHSSGPVCSPTRAGLMTGRYQQRAGIPAVVSVKLKHLGMSSSELTFAEVLRDVGYTTALFGKWHLGYAKRFNPMHQGFDEFRGYVSGNVDYQSHVDQSGAFDWWHNDRQVDEEGYTTHLITRHATRFIRANRDRAFCLYLAHEAPHYPYQGPRDAAERTVGGKFTIQGSRKDVAGAYREMVEALDASVGDVLACLDECELSQETLVLFFSDNGANRHGSNGPLRGLKGSLWEGGHRVPLLAWSPGRIGKGRVSSQLATTLDIFPTLVSVSRAHCKRELDGMDLSPILFEDAKPQSRTVFWGYRKQRAMRDGDWKLVIPDTSKNQPQLFNVADDIAESENLASRQRRRVERMRAAISDWDTAVGPSDFP